MKEIAEFSALVTGVAMLLALLIVTIHQLKKQSNR